MLLSAAILSFAIGLFGGYLGYADEAEHQFHGGILEEDLAEAEWALATGAASGFLKAAGLAILVLGAPIAIGRLARENAKSGPTDGRS